MKIFSIEGQVRESSTKKGPPGLKVEAWDKDLLFNDLLGSAFTDRTGAFKIEFTEARYRDCFLDRRPDLYFLVYLGRRLIKSTEDSILWNLKKASEAVIIEIDLPPGIHPSLHFESIDPIIRFKRKKGKIRALATIANLDETKAEMLSKKIRHPLMVEYKLLRSLVRTGDLTESEAQSISLTTSIYQLIDDNLELVEALKTNTFSQMRKGRVTQIKDLTIFEPKDWLAIFERSEVQPPQGWNRKSYAVLLAKKVENLYPSETLQARVTTHTADGVARDLEDLQPLFEYNDKPLTASFDDLDLTGLDEATVERLRKSHSRLKGLANTYPGLSIHTLLDNPLQPADAKEKIVRERIGMIIRFHAQNSDKEFLFLDYSPESDDIQSLDFTGFDEEQKCMVLKTVKVFKEIYSVTWSSKHTLHLIGKGFHSPEQIVNISLSNFHSKSELNESVAAIYYKRACDII